jgi:hypothetical protein
MAPDDFRADDTYELGSAIRQLLASLRDATDGTDAHSRALKTELDLETEKRRKAKEQADTDKKKLDNDKKSLDANKKLKDNAITLGKELLNIANAGVKFANAIGVSATKGVELELSSRYAIAKQIFSLGSSFGNLAVTMEQLKGAQQGFSDVFTGAREGMQVSAKGSIEFVQSLKKGFKSEFTPTAETFRMLTQMGMSTTSQFEAFRKSTGRASLSNNQLATLYNKNSLSFLLYGNSFSKAAVNAERLGVNLASVQSAQESMVTNLDGTIDTVAQLNQLGAQIDFGRLTQLNEFEGPEATMAYLRATIPEEMIKNSASMRALFKGMGVPLEDFLKSGQAQVSAADDLEKQLSEQATATKSVTGFLGSLGATASKFGSILEGSFGALTIAAIAAAQALIKVAATGGMANLGGTLGKAAGIGGGLIAGTGLGMAMGGSVVGSGIGSVIGTALGIALIPALGPFGPMLGGTIGGAIGGYLSKPKTAADMISGYGKRTLLTPEGPIALNNQDTVIAGTNLFKGDDVFSGPKGSLSLANMAMNTGQLGMAATEKGAMNQFIRKTLPYLASMGKLGGKGIDLTRTVDTVFGTVGKNSSIFTKYLAKNIQAIPIIGSLIGGLISGGMEYAESGSLLRALGKGSLSALGGIGGSIGASMLTAGNPIAASLGGIGGSMLGESAFDKMFGKTADDMYSSGYGDRTLTTSKGTFALNNADDVIAGTDLFTKTQSRATAGNADNSVLVKKIDSLISALANANTTIQVNGQTQSVSRLQLVGVYTRNEIT